MRTLLINPPYAFSEAPIMSLGLAYIAAVLEANGHEVQLLDLLVSKSSKDSFRLKMAEFQPEIVGTTCVTMNYHPASNILKVCKAINPDVVTVIGGPHVTFRPTETLNEAPWIDIVVRGEGEQTILDLVGGRRPDDTDGIAFRSNRPRLTSTRTLFKDLDALPFPARHLFPFSKYVALGCPCSMTTGRGCPFACTFCVGSRMGGRKPRLRSAKHVVDEIEHVLGLGFKEVNFEDDLLTLNHRHLNAVCDEIIARGLKFTWGAFSRVDTVNAQMLDKMRLAGCTGLLYGVESGNQAILDKAKKKTTLASIREGVRLANEAGIGVIASFIMGLPGETRETLAESMEFAKSLGVPYGFHVLAPFPGTEVREKAQELGIEILTDDWSKYDANRPVTRTDGAGPKDIAAALRKYFAELREVFSYLEQGGAGPGQAAVLRSKRRTALAWAIIKNHMVEDSGPLEADGNPLESLVTKVTGLVPGQDELVSELMREWVAEGLVRFEHAGNGVLWRWR